MTAKWHVHVKLSCHVGTAGHSTRSGSQVRECFVMLALQAIAPEWHCSRGSTSTLAKLIKWHTEEAWQQVPAALLAWLLDVCCWHSTQFVGYVP